MAADTTKRNVLKMCKKNLDKLLNIHIILYNEICDERRRLERLCYLNKQLLQPWSCKGRSGARMLETLPHTNHTCANSEESTVSVESLNIEDTKEVELVNKLLAKATKARSTFHQESESNKAEEKSHPLANLPKDNKRNHPPVVKLDKSANNPRVAQCSDTKPSVKIHKPGRMRPASSTGPKGPSPVIPPYRTDPDRGRKNNAKAHRVRNSGRQLASVHSAVIRKGSCVDGQRNSETVSLEPSVNSNVDGSVNCVVNKNVNSQQNQCNSSNESQPMMVQPQHNDQGKNETLPATLPLSEDRFHLVRDGSKLTVPSQLKKQLTQNMELKEKLNACRLTAKVDQLTHKDTFLQRLNDMVDVNEKVKLAAKVHTQTLIHEKLLTELTNICSAPLTGELSASEILRKRMLLEMIFQTYEMCGREVSHILQDDLIEGLASSIHPHHVELPQHLVNKTQHLLEFKSMNRAGDVEYHSEKHLLRYLRAGQTLTSLTVQQIITRGVLEDLLPELDLAGKQSSHSVVPLYRAVFSLLSHPGHQLPTIVQDTTDIE